MLSQNIRRLKRKRQSTETEEQMLENVERMRMMIEATERVTFVDSVVTGKRDFLSAVKLSAESGELIPYSTFFQTPDSSGSGCMVYKNELGNRIIYAKPEAGELTRLYMSDLIDGKWSDTRRLDELDGYPQGYPFLLSDGATLYFAAMGEESIGGYDIFVTRYNADDNEFLSPENVGMPFNSPANDYLLAFDEYSQLGWLVTDRNQPEDTVCVYVFIPNNSRRVYDTNIYEDDIMAGLALVSSIADTWGDKEEVAAAKQRLEEVKSAETKVQREKDFEFVVNDEYTYTLLSDFKSEEARNKMQSWLENSAKYKKDKAYLESLRDMYSAADEEERKTLSPQILLHEKDCETEAAKLRAEAKEIRNTEIKKLNASGSTEK